MTYMANTADLVYTKGGGGAIKVSIVDLLKLI